MVWRYADTGALIQGGTNSNNQDLPIVRLSQSRSCACASQCPRDDIRYVHEGDELTVRVDCHQPLPYREDRSLHARRQFRNPHHGDRDRRARTKDLSISPGMYANTMLRLAHLENVVTIPIEALVLNGRQRMVYVLDASNHVHVRPVQVGIEGNKLAEIRSGLNPGDRVIVGGQEKYQEDEEVSSELENTQASETVAGDRRHDRPEG